MVVRKFTILTVVAAAVTLPGVASAQDAAGGAPAKGEQIFKQCMTCHRIGPDAKNKLGPEMNGIDGRHSGTAPNFNYSDANKNSGIVWNETTFKQYIADPKAMVPGTKMFFPGIKNPQEVNDLWAYVSQFDADGNIKK